MFSGPEEYNNDPHAVWSLLLKLRERIFRSLNTNVGYPWVAEDLFIWIILVFLSPDCSKRLPGLFLISIQGNGFLTAFYMYSLFDPTPPPSHLSTPPTPTWTLCRQIYLFLTSLKVTSYVNFPTGDWYLPLHPQGFLCYLNGVNAGILLHRGDLTCASSLNPKHSADLSLNSSCPSHQSSS